MIATPLLFPDERPAAPATPPPPRAAPAPDPRFPGAQATHLEQIARGRHPLGRALPGPEGETCGSCGHARNVNPNPGGKVIYQCEQGVRGVSCRVRVRWPACKRWASVAAVEEDRLAEYHAGRMP